MKLTHILKTGLIMAPLYFAFSAVMADGAPKASAAVQIPSPPKGKGQLVLFRTTIIGMLNLCNVRENGKLVTKVGSGKYSVVSIDPGHHKLTSRSEATSEINIEVDPDETYYLKCSMKMGFMVYRPSLSPATKEDFDAKSAGLSQEDPKKLADEIAKDVPITPSK
jgi:hypothetical protein